MIEVNFQDRATDYPVSDYVDIYFPFEGGYAYAVLDLEDPYDRPIILDLYIDSRVLDMHIQQDFENVDYPLGAKAVEWILNQPVERMVWP